MKQTNNAIKFLMAQYRAIFKHAYLKGLVSAAVLTAGLAVGATANAEVLTGNYVYDEEQSGYFNDSSTELSGTGITVGEDKGVTLSGSHTLNNFSISINANDPVGTGARLGFNSGEGKGTITVIGQNYIGEQVTIHSQTDFASGSGQEKGSVNVAGYLTVSKDADGSNLSAADIFINPLNSGDKKGYGDLTIDPNITVGNLTFSSPTDGKSTDIDVYADIGVYDDEEDTYANIEDGSANFGKRTITVAKGGTVTFASGAHVIKSSILTTSLEAAEDLSDGADEAYSGADLDPSLVFEAATDGQAFVNIETSGSLEIQQPVTFSGGIVVNNSGSISTVSGSADKDGFIDKSGNLTISASTFNNTGSLSIGTGTTLTVNGNSTFNAEAGSTITNEGTLNVDTGSKVTLNTGSSFENAKTAEEDVSLVVLSGASFTNNSDNFTNASGATHNVSGTFTNNGTYLNEEGGKLHISGTNGLFTNDGTLENAGEILVSGSGKFNNNGTFTNAADSTLKVSGTSTFTNNNVLTNAGDILVSGSASLANKGSLTNDGTLTVSGSSANFTTADTSSLTNNGTLTVSGSGLSVNIVSGSTFTNTGKVVVDSGSLNIAGTADLQTGTQLSLLNSATITADNTALDITNATFAESQTGTIKASGSSGSVTFDFDKPVGGITFKATSGGTLITDTLSGSVSGTLGQIVLSGTDTTLEVSTLKLTGTATIASTDANLNDFTGKLQVNKELNAAGDITFTNVALQLGKDSGSIGTIGQNLILENETTVLGSWSSSKTVSVSGNGALAIGNADNIGSLNVAALEVATGSSVDVTTNSSLITKDITVSGSVNVAGTMTANGKDTSTTISGGNADYMGFDLENSNITVDAGKFVIGSTAANGILNNDTETGFEFGESGAVVDKDTFEEGEQGYVFNNFGEFTLTNGGTLSIQFAKGTEFKANEIKQIKHELISGVTTDGVIKDGILDIGLATITDFSQVIKPSEDGSGSTITWEDFQSIQTGGTGNTLNEQIAETKVTGVNGNFSGAVGSAQTSTSGGALVVSGNAVLANASINNNKFVTDVNGNVADVSVSAGSTIALKGDGEVKQAILAAGTEENQTIISLEQTYTPDGSEPSQPTTITVAGVDATNNLATGDPDYNNGINENTVVNIAQNVTGNFTDDVTVDTLVATGNVQTADKKTVTTNNFTSAEGTSLKAYNFTVHDSASIKGSVNVANDMSINSTERVEGELVYAAVDGEVVVGNNLDSTNAVFSQSVSVGETLSAMESTFGNTVSAKSMTATGSTFSNVVKVTNDLNASGVTFASGSVVSAESATFTGTADNASVIDGEFVATKKVTFGKVNSGTTNDAAQVTVTNKFAADELEFVEAQGTGLNVLDGTVATNKLTGANGVTISVGAEGTDDATGTLAIAGSMDLNGATLYVDPEYGTKTAVAVAGSLTKAGKGDLGKLTGNVYAGQNSAVGVGVDEAGLRSIIAQFQDAGSFVDPILGDGQYGAMTYFDKPVTIGYGYGITITAHNGNDLQDTISGSSVMVDANNDGKKDTIQANTIFIDEGAALAVNINNAKDDAAYITFEPAPTTGDDPVTTAIEETPAQTTDKGTLVSNGGEILLYGDTYKKSYQLFEDGVAIVGLDGQETDVTVVSANGLLESTLNKDGSVQLNLNKDKAKVFMASASAPVQTTITAYLNGYNGTLTEVKDEATGEITYEGDYLYTLDANGNPDTQNYNNYFLSRIVMGGSAADAEKVARLGVYGGTHQAALVAGSSTTDAVAGRMGVGAQTGSITFADNGQGAGLWVSPIYKSHDSDGFGAQGVSYGADLDITGVALGGDFTMANGVRLGAAFNVGSGDADGQGAGAGVSNDFDYYGFSIYGGFTSGAMSVLADVSYTAVDNDITGNTGVEKVSATMDSTNLSFGLTGAYAMDLNGMSVTPHAGLRFTQIDMDDYTVKGSGDIAKYSADSANIFSIPVGVTFAKEIVTGSWTVKPALDLTLTANMGDDSVDGTVSWAGIENLQTKVESEVIDSFTYGATLGLSAKSGNFSFGFGVNYTGASSADEYGVNANARFVF